MRDLVGRARLDVAACRCRGPADAPVERAADVVRDDGDAERAERSRAAAMFDADVAALRVFGNMLPPPKTRLVLMRVGGDAAHEREQRHRAPGARRPCRLAPALDRMDMWHMRRRCAAGRHTIATHEPRSVSRRSPAAPSAGRPDGARRPCGRRWRSVAIFRNAPGATDSIGVCTARGLGDADEEEPPGLSCASTASTTALGGGVEVDQHVAQEDGVERADGLGRLVQVELAEPHVLAQLGLHLHHALRLAPPRGSSARGAPASRGAAVLGEHGACTRSSARGR